MSSCLAQKLLAPGGCKVFLFGSLQLHSSRVLLFFYASLLSGLSMKISVPQNDTVICWIYVAVRSIFRFNKRLVLKERKRNGSFTDG